MTDVPNSDELLPLLRYAGAAVAALLLLGLALGKNRAGGAVGGCVVVAALGWLSWDHNGHALPPVPFLQDPDGILSSTERGLLCMGLAAIAGVCVSWLPATLRWAPRLVVAGVLCGWMLETPASRWQGTDAALWLFSLAGALLLWQDLVDRVVEARPGPDALIVLALAAGALAQSCIGYGSARLAETAGTLAMMIGGTALLAPWFGHVVLSPAVLGVFTTALFAVGLDAWFYGADPVIPWHALAVFGAAPVMVSIGRLPPVVRRRPRVARAAAIVLALAVLGGGFWLAAESAPEPIEGDSLQDLYGPK